MATRKADRCKIPGCNRPHHARGYCQNCYDDLRKKKKKADPVKSHSRDKKSRPVLKPKPAPVPHAQPAPAAPGKTRQLRKRAPADALRPHKAPASGEEAVKTGRLALIKIRHEAIKREIDQIREDLESEEEE